MPTHLVRTYGCREVDLVVRQIGSGDLRDKTCLLRAVRQRPRRAGRRAETGQDFLLRSDRQECLSHWPAAVPVVGPVPSFCKPRTIRLRGFAGERQVIPSVVE